MNDDLKINNFDLLRLFAASQVILGHGSSHLALNGISSISFIWTLAGCFPGVPIFFIISGFLISASFEKTPIIKSYAINRILRIYPALWVSFFISIILVTICGYWQTVGFTHWDFLKWSIAQLSILQFYNPSFLRGFGVGVLNGSLWTISVELQFYLLVPLLYRYLYRLDKSQGNYLLLGLMCIFVCINFAIKMIAAGLLLKMLNVSFLPHFYMFLMGIFYQRNIHYLLKMIEGKFFIYFILYILTCYTLRNHIQLGNALSFPIFLLLSLLTISFAFSFKTLSNRILRKNDISYGLYIYHMIIINVFVQFHFTSRLTALGAVFIFSIGLATLSWFFIEKPALSLKHRKALPTPARIVLQP